jgi:hypothetical protein
MVVSMRRSGDWLSAVVSRDTHCAPWHNSWPMSGNPYGRAVLKLSRGLFRLVGGRINRRCPYHNQRPAGTKLPTLLLRTTLAITR